MIGPKGLSRIVNALRVVAPELPFEIQYMEITEQEQSFGFDGFRITAFRVNHNVICYGYSIEIDRKGKFQLDKAMALG
ncbi:ribonuclease Z, partial [Klebsiella oxytoca]